MERFARLFARVEGALNPAAKTDALVDYFRETPDTDKVWAIALILGKRPKRPMTTATMRSWAAESAGISDWLFDESYEVVGDLAETMALLVHKRRDVHKTKKSLTKFITLVISMHGMDRTKQKRIVQKTWKRLDFHACFLFIKLLTGSFRMRVTRKMLTRALARATGIEESIIAHKLIADWDPTDITYKELVLDHKPEDLASKPYPFAFVDLKQGSLSEAELLDAWQVEWKWNGLRAQVIVRNGHPYVWSSDEELLTDRFPEFEHFADLLPDGTVLDGEVIAFNKGLPMDFRSLQRRLGRKIISQKLQEEIPVVFMAYDLLENSGTDMRERTLSERRSVLENLIPVNDTLLLSSVLPVGSKDELHSLLNRAREKQCDGFVIKRKESIYSDSVTSDNWRNWKAEPYSIDAVLTYATRNQTRRTNTYSDYTFGLWEKGELVTFAKATPELTDEEIKQMNDFIKESTIDRFGPVRQVEPELVFEIAFEGIASSTRHKSGVAVRSPRIIQWWHDKKPKEANSLDDLKQLIPLQNAGAR